MKRGFFLLTIVIFSLFLVSGFQGTSTSYTTDNRADSFSDTSSTSSSFTQRLIGGIQTVGEYITTTFSGRFGLLGAPVSLDINVTSPLNNANIIRGSDSVSGEDDKGYVNNSLNITAKVFDSSNNNAFEGATCYFYDESNFLGSFTTGASGICTMNFSHDGLGLGQRNLSVNYSITTSDVLAIKISYVNISLIQYLTTLTMGGKTTSGCASGGSCYHHGDNATLDISIDIINETGTIDYDPQNISANATNAAESLYQNGALYYPNGITRTAAGTYNATIQVNASFGGDLRWDVVSTDDNFLNVITSAVHSDVELCLTDWGSYGGWSACSGNQQTRTRTDSSGCSDVEIQSCITESCFPAGTKILMADGSEKNIEDVELGDEVEAYDLVTGKFEIAKVLELESPIREGFYSINDKVNVTDEHPFYVRKQNGELGWASINKDKTELDLGSLKLGGLPIYNIEIGDEIFTTSENWEVVKTIKHYPGNVQTYNLKTVDKYHVFFANDFLVHNKDHVCDADPWNDFAWGDWGVCDALVEGSEARSKTNNCDETLIDIRDCECIPNWECLIGECVDGLQNKTCMDSSLCEDDSSEIISCIGNIIFLPADRSLTITNGTTIDFSVDIPEDLGDVLEVKWYVGGEFIEGNFGSGSLFSSFSYLFVEDLEIKSKAIVDAEIQIAVWDVVVLEDDCIPNWGGCKLTACDGKYKYYEKCVDVNYCGKDDNKPYRKECNCVPDYDCEEWSECNVDYDLKDVLTGEVSIGGLQYKECVEISDCEFEDDIVIKEQVCSLGVPIKVVTVEWCFENYVELYDTETNKLVARLKEIAVKNIKSLDIIFTVTEFEGICGYCYDGIKNFDETGVDCGGGCLACSEKGIYFDYLGKFNYNLWILIILSIAGFVYVNRGRLYESTLGEFVRLGAPLIRKVDDLSYKKPKFLERAPKAYKKFRLGWPRIKFAMPKLSIKFGRVVKRKPLVQKLPVAKPKKYIPSIRLPKIKVSRLRMPDRLRDLKAMMRRWKNVPVYATARYEGELKNAIRNWERKRSRTREIREIERARSKALRDLERRRRIAEKSRRKEEKIRLKEQRVLIKKQEEARKQREKQSRGEEKIRKRNEKRVVKVRKKQAKKIKKKHKKLVRKEVKVIKKRLRKKQVHRSEVSDLRRKMNGWKAKGYYQSRSLERKLDKFEKKK